MSQCVDSEIVFISIHWQKGSRDCCTRLCIAVLWSLGAPKYNRFQNSNGL